MIFIFTGQRITTESGRFEVEADTLEQALNKTMDNKGAFTRGHYAPNTIIGNIELIDTKET